MLFYHLGALVKIIVGILLGVFLFQYINIYQDEVVGLLVGFFSIFLISWGVAFYIFFVSQKLLSDKDSLTIASKAYKMSLLFGFFILINVALIILEKWNKIIGAGLLLLFIILQIISSYEYTKK